jgi:putative ABC transport system substrate-binding protein
LNQCFGFLRSTEDEKQGSVPRSKERVMSTPIGRVHGHRRHAGGQRQEATTWRSTVGCLVTLALLSVPLAAEAQLPRTIPRVAYLALAPGPLDAVSSERSEALAQGLRELGYVEGKNLIMEYWWSAGNIDRLRENAAELVRLGVHVIVTQGAVATRAAKDMTRTIPIVMGGDTDPVGDGFVASLGSPGGNITGVTTLHRELSGKRLELLKDAVPGMVRVAVLYNPVEVSAVRQLRDTEEAARVLGLQVHALQLRRHCLKKTNVFQLACSSVV